MATVERRTFVDGADTQARSVDGDTRAVEGYAAVFDTETVIGGAYRERIAPGAFAAAVAGKRDFVALLNHDPGWLLGRAQSDPPTVTISVDDHGLRYRIEPPATALGDHVIALAARGDLAGSSFGFVPVSETWEDAKDADSLPLRTIDAVDLIDVSPCVFPAYPETGAPEARARVEAFRAREPVATPNAAAEPPTSTGPTTDQLRRRLRLLEVGG